jgi:putative membrane protein
MSSPAVAPDSTHLAMDRTWLAHERTLMAWVRTATSMISFGFTIYKFFELEAGRGAPVARGIITPRDFALIMVSIGLAALLMATISYRKEVRTLSNHLDGRRSRAVVVAALVSVFGFLVLFSAIFHG